MIDYESIVYQNKVYISTTKCATSNAVIF